MNYVSIGNDCSMGDFARRRWFEYLLSNLVVFFVHNGDEYSNSKKKKKKNYFREICMKIGKNNKKINSFSENP